MRSEILLLCVALRFTSVSGGVVSKLCKLRLSATPALQDFRYPSGGSSSHCSSSSVSGVWVVGSCSDRMGRLLMEGRHLLSNDFGFTLSGDESTTLNKCTALCKAETSRPLGWQHCAEQGHECACRGIVRFGSSSERYLSERYVEGSAPCTSGFFGVGNAEAASCHCRLMYTGCELVARTESDSGCYVHTSDRIYMGSGSSNAMCWTHTRWHDSQADGCEWYAQAPHRCRVYGNRYAYYGMTGKSFPTAHQPHFPFFSYFCCSHSS